MLVPTVNDVVVCKLGMFVFETAETEQLLLSIEDPELVKVVIVNVFAVLVVEGDSMFDIEKDMVVPEGAELLKQLDKETCWANGKQVKAEFRINPVEILVQICVWVDITGVKELLGAPFQVDGN